MEDTLGGDVRASLRFPITCLNPCFNGRYSRSDVKYIFVSMYTVLILVLMEDTLGEPSSMEVLLNGGLNPCFNGRYSRSDQHIVDNRDYTTQS